MTLIRKAIMQGKTQLNADKWQMLENFSANTIVAAILSFWAGGVNGLATLSILFERATHVSGRLADIGIDAILNPINAAFMFLIWVSFVGGSYLGGALLNRIGLTKGLVLQSLLLLAAAIAVRVGFSANSPDDFGIGKAVMAFMLPFAMGFQNSLTTQLPLDRTTHWTGSSTDLGICLSKREFSESLFICIKILSFIVGAAIMAVLVSHNGIDPFLALIIISSGIFLTAVLGDRSNRRYLLHKARA